MHRLFALLALSTLGSLPALASEPIDLSIDEFKMYQHYKNAMEDPRVQKMKPEVRLSAIAKDAGFPMKKLQAAIDKGDAAGDIKAKCMGAIKEQASSGALSGRVSKVDVDTSVPHAVAYVEWQNEDLGQLEEEASTLAVNAQKACPILSTIQLWAQDKAAPSKRVFQALISASSAARINADRIKDFADTRYIRLFEKVKSVTAGDDLSSTAAK
jgi:hypothetical protein